MSKTVSSQQDEFILEIGNLVLNFGGVEVLKDVTFNVRAHEILAIIGPNGAGKTCILNCINEFYRPQGGRIYFEGRDITHLRPDKIANLGISRTFQNIQLYTGMSVVDNLMAARHDKLKYNWFTGGLYLGRAKVVEVAHRGAIEGVIDFLEMEAIRSQPVGSLAYGLRKRVDLGRALAQEPKLLLLDEPMAGMVTEEKEDMARFIIDTHELYGTSIILVEHDMGVVMDIADRIIVLDFGNKIAEGSPREIGQNPAVIKAYLGSRAR